MVKYMVELIGEKFTFDNQREARSKVIDLMNFGIFYIKTYQEGKEEEKPKPDEEESEEQKKPKKKLRGPYKKKTGPKVGSHNEESKSKYTKQVIEFIRNNALTKSDEMIITALKYRFGVKVSLSGLKWQMSQNNITRRDLRKKITDGKEDLRILPPEDLE